MSTVRFALVVSLFSLSIGVALAQPGSGKGPGPGPGMGQGAAASAPGMGPGAGGRATRWGADYTPGWSQMNATERSEHQARMRAMKTYDECKAYQQQHHEQMAARAKERGGKALGQPRRDGCAGLKP